MRLLGWTMLLTCRHGTSLFAWLPGIIFKVAHWQSMSSHAPGCSILWLTDGSIGATMAVSEALASAAWHLGGTTRSRRARLDG